jgi:tRNA pseudouridine55 synthase
MNGIVVVDKPADMTSAHLVARVRKLLEARKVGHTGTLDPFATGVVVCCINQATRLAQFLTYGKKGYQAVMRLGIRTDTQDFTGRVISRQNHLAVTDQQIRSVFRRFLEIKEQAPPAFSALKFQGVPLYRLARKGKFVQKPCRRVSIYELEVLGIDLPFVRFEVICSQGTYIRTLCDDIGQALGCGAHLAQLCRTDNSGFTLQDAVSLNTLQTLAATGRVASILTSMTAALRGIPQVTAGSTLAQKIQYGQPITGKELEFFDGATSSWIKVTNTEGKLIAVLSSDKKNGVHPYACVFPK